MSRRLLGGAAILLLVTGLAVYGGNQVIRVSAMRRELEAMERDLVALRARSEALTKTVERLRTDPSYIEQLAREDLGYVREGDEVWKFPSHGK